MARKHMFTDEQSKEIRAKYEISRTTTVQLAKEYGCSKSTIKNAIKRAGGKIRSISESQKLFTLEQNKAIREKYENSRTSTAQLAEEYGCSVTVINKAIKRAGGKIRSISESRLSFTPEQDDAIRAKYESSRTPTTQLAEEYGCSAGAILSAIKRAGGKIRSQYEEQLIFTPDQDEAIREQYESSKTSTAQLAKQYGCCPTSILSAIKRAGGKARANKITPLSQSSVDITNDLIQIVNSLGSHISSLPQKSWLAILRQSKVLNNIGGKSAFAPIKIQLLRGELKPEDILPPASAPTAPADAPQPVSKLQQELNKVIASRGGEDIEPDETQPAPSEQPVDIIDDDDQTKARLANLRPAQRLGVVAAASNATSDEQTLQSICHAQCEALWEQVFRADQNNPAEARQIISEFQQQPATDKWTEYTKNTFLTDWRLVQECGQIPGLMMPDGWRLNLMQRREAALLLRDRARLNISGMGAGKTLSAIAGMQIIGANRVLVLCPNATIESSWQLALSNHLPLATTATRTWQPEFDGTKEPHWVLNHHELLSDMRATELAAFLWFFEPDAVIIDETHLCKCRDDTTESQRYRNLTTLTDWCRDNNSAIYGLSGTPVVNELSEPISLLRLIRPDIAQKLDKRLSGDNAMAVHEALQPISSRYVPEPAARLIQKTIEVRADYLTEEALEASERNGIAVDAALAPAKFNALVDLASKQGKLLVFTSSVAGVVNEAVAALEQAGINAVVHTGSEKGEGYNGNVQRFITDPDVKVLIASTSTLATGFDGLQKVCRRIAFLTLPWTDAEQAQAIARILRQGIKAETVELTTLCAVLNDPLTGNEWSLDRQKLERLNSKRTLSAAVCDGVIPDESALRGGLRMVERAHRKWANNVRKKLEEQSK